MNIEDLKFELKDCLIVGATRDGGRRGDLPVIFGIPEANVRNGRPMTPEEINEITVIHQPTGIRFTANKGGAQQNRRVAIDTVKQLVEAKIKEVQDAARLQSQRNN